MQRNAFCNEFCRDRSIFRSDTRAEMSSPLFDCVVDSSRARQCFHILQTFCRQRVHIFDVSAVNFAAEEHPACFVIIWINGGLVWRPHRDGRMEYVDRLCVTLTPLNDVIIRRLFKRKINIKTSYKQPQSSRANEPSFTDFKRTG